MSRSERRSCLKMMLMEMVIGMIVREVSNVLVPKMVEWDECTEGGVEMRRSSGGG